MIRDLMIGTRIKKIPSRAGNDPSIKTQGRLFNFLQNCSRYTFVSLRYSNWREALWDSLSNWERIVL